MMSPDVNTTLRLALPAAAPLDEPALVEHLHRTVLDRAAAEGERAHWRGEVARLREAGVGGAEATLALTQALFASEGYARRERDAPGFILDLHACALGRAPDAPALAYWMSQLRSGLPREAAIATFLFSREFASVLAAVHGTDAGEGPGAIVVDLHRGFLSRLPRPAELTHGLRALQEAQSPEAMHATVAALVGALIEGDEYLAPARSALRQVGDAYNALLHRAGTLAELSSWAGGIETGARTFAQSAGAILASDEGRSRLERVLRR